MKKAVFIDKDGTLIKDVPYNVDPRLIELYDGAVHALQALKRQGYLLVVVSNQSGVARGYFSLTELKPVEDKLRHELEKNNVELTAFYFCPHHPEGTVKEFAIDCFCRKPRPGMLVKAAEDYDIDLTNSWMVGDILNDVEAGNAVGCKTILINNGNETEWQINASRTPYKTAADLTEAVQFILETEHENANTIC
jgi:D-glycero-D-manno-heptose 1,7-bisphosphate phosphatase